MSVTLPIVDLRLGRNPATRQDVAKVAVSALKGSGFLYMEGIEGFKAEDLHGLCDWFFRLPMEYKMSVAKKMFNPSSNHTYRGYFPVQPGHQSHKEAFEIGGFFDGPGKSPHEECKFFFEDNPWPKDPPQSRPFASEFQNKMEEYFKILSKAGLELLELVAEGWGAETDLFTKLFDPHHLSTLRLIRYPDRGNDLPDCVKAGDYILRCDPHQDSGFVTMLETFNNPGLQIQNAEGCWKDVEHRPNSLIVNIGILFSKMTDGVLKATPHRVVYFGGERFSVPFFLEPNYAANVNQKLNKNDVNQEKKLQTTGPSLSYGKWTLNNLIGYIEYESLKKIEIPS